jgi:N-acetylneuraminate synthase
MEFSQTEWEGLYLHAKERNIIFLSSVFSIKSIDLLSKIGVSAWKVGSGEVNNKILLDKLIQTQKPILLSTGMSNWDEINQVVNFLEEDDASYGLFQCTSKYPTTYEEIGLNVISEFRKKFNVPIGFSDHSGNIFPALYAMALGVNLVELHVTFHKQIFGPDTASSVTFEELKTVVDARDAFHKMKVSSVNKDTMESGLLEMKELFGRSVCLINDLPKGTVLEAAMLTTKKPSTGIRHDQLKECIGRKLKKGVSANRVLLWEDLEQNPD